MTPIPESIIESAVAWITNLDEDQIEELIEQYSDQQPFMFGFLLTMGEEDFSEDEQELFLYLGMVVWHAMSAHYGPLRAVEEADFSEVETSNLALLESLEDQPDEAFAKVAAGILLNHNQSQLLQYLVEVLQDEQDILESENFGPMFIFLKILVECFDLQS
ncbi:MAG: hypothetical protein NW241_10735 [Bacteroidia bacterium]|nr:hypothetical protein [Bacteroidia bacterium]